MSWLQRIVYFILDLFLLDRSPARIAGSIVLGMFIGLSSKMTLQWYFFMFLLFALSVHVPTGILSALIFRLCSQTMDAMAHRLGHFILVDAPGLRPIWSRFYHSPIIPFTSFNHTVVMGHLLIASLLALPLFLISFMIFRRYGGLIFDGFKRTALGYFLRDLEFYRNYVRKRQKA